jgi:alpha-methylacyl-CoA racemase
MDEAPRHPHNQARHTFLVRDGVVQPAPAPRFSRTQAEPGPPARPATEAILADCGFTGEEIAALRAANAI